MKILEKEQVLSKFTKRRILVTGSSGYIGQKACKDLINFGAQVLGVDKDAIKSKTDQEEFSLTSTSKINKIIREFKPDLIYHAGTNSASDYFENFLSAFNEDYKSLSNIISSIYQNNLQGIPLIFFSSSYVYSGEPINQIVRENNKLQPHHNFGVGKRFFEEMISRSYKYYDIYRLSSVFGDGQPRKPNAVFNMIKQAKTEKQIDLWGTGNRKMQYVSIDDVVLHSLGPSLHKPDIYNLGSNNYLSTSDIVKCIANATNADVNILDSKPEGETLPFMENNKIKSTNSYEFGDVLENIYDFAKKDI